MEEELEAVKTQLQSKERELELWKDRVQRMTEVSLASASGSFLAPNHFHMEVFWGSHNRFSCSILF